MELYCFAIIVGYNIGSLSLVNEYHSMLIELELANKDQTIFANWLELFLDWLQTEDVRVVVF